MVDLSSESFEAAKPWYQSKTILGGAAVLISQAVAVIGYQLDGSVALEIVTNLVSIAGGAMAIVGRVRAVQPIR